MGGSATGQRKAAVSEEGAPLLLGPLAAADGGHQQVHDLAAGLVGRGENLLHDQQPAVVGDGTADRLEDLAGMVVVPAVQDVGEEIDVAAVGDVPKRSCRPPSGSGW